MAAFASGEVSLSAATATQIVDAAEFDRRVHLYGDAVHVAFVEGDAASGARLGGSTLVGGTSFALPAGQELWAYHSSGGTVGFIATNAA